MTSAGLARDTGDELLTQLANGTSPPFEELSLQDLSNLLHRNERYPFGLENEFGSGPEDDYELATDVTVFISADNRAGAIYTSSFRPGAFRLEELANLNGAVTSDPIEACLHDAARQGATVTFSRSFQQAYDLESGAWKIEPGQAFGGASLNGARELTYINTELRNYLEGQLGTSEAAMQIYTSIAAAGPEEIEDLSPTLMRQILEELGERGLTAKDARSMANDLCETVVGHWVSIGRPDKAAEMAEIAALYGQVGRDPGSSPEPEFPKGSLQDLESVLGVNISDGGSRAASGEVCSKMAGLVHEGGVVGRAARDAAEILVEKVIPYFARRGHAVEAAQCAEAAASLRRSEILQDGTPLPKL